MNSFSFAYKPKSFGTALKIGFFVVAVVLLNSAGAWLATQANIQIWPEHMQIIEWLWISMLVTYAVFMMLPFVPGIEIGLILMMMLGDGGIVLVYLSTQIALSASFMIGQRLSLPAYGRQNKWFSHSVLTHPHIGLAILINLPGNAICGGAGGIALLAGSSGLFCYRRYALTMALATAPIPLAMLIFNIGR